MCVCPCARISRVGEACAFDAAAVVRDRADIDAEPGQLLAAFSISATTRWRARSELGTPSCPQAGAEPDRAAGPGRGELTDAHARGGFDVDVEVKGQTREER